MLDQPPPATPPASPARAGTAGPGTEERWYDVPAWEDPAEVEAQTQESLKQWRQALREGKAGTAQPGAEATGETNARWGSSSSEEDSIGVDMDDLQRRLDALRDFGGSSGTGSPRPDSPQGSPTPSEARGAGQSTAWAESSSSEEDPFDLDDLQRRLDTAGDFGGSSSDENPFASGKRS
jgi:hypothetical protein